MQFRAISGDHSRAAIPHLYARIGDGEVIIELPEDKIVRLSRAHSIAIRGHVTVRELRLVLAIAQGAYDELLDLWSVSQP